MTVAEAAARYGVSTTAIYNRLKGIENKGREKNGEISAKGVACLESWFVPVERLKHLEEIRNQEDSKLEETVSKLQSTIETQQETIQSLLKQNAALQEQNARLQEALVVLSQKTLPAPKKIPNLFERAKLFIFGSEQE